MVRSLTRGPGPGGQEDDARHREGEGRRQDLEAHGKAQVRPATTRAALGASESEGGGPLRKADGRLEDRVALEGVHDLAERLAKGATLGALGEMGLEVASQKGIQGAVELVRQELLGSRAVHGGRHVRGLRPARAAMRRLASSIRPRLMRLFTVPKGMPRVVATSS